MRMLEEFFPEFTEKLEEIDKLYAEKRMIDEKTYQFICFALSIKARSKPCVLKHSREHLKQEPQSKSSHISCPGNEGSRRRRRLLDS